MTLIGERLHRIECRAKAPPLTGGIAERLKQLDNKSMMKPIPPSAFDIQAELRRLPTDPGVYRMYDASGNLLYVGKAQSLRARVRSYFQQDAQHSAKIRAMVAQVAYFDVVVTDTEIEALVLESNLVKAHQPKYNVLLKDDKRFPWIGIETGPYPRLFVTRLPRRDSRKSKRGEQREQYFGPYVNSADMHVFLKVVRKHFPLRQRRRPLFKDRPCMNYDLGLCPGPCQGLISETDYQKTLAQVALFLKGKSDELLDLIEIEMQAASVALDFEQAARLRDRYQAVAALQATQKVFRNDPDLNLDVLGAAHDEARLTVTVMQVRHGKLIASHSRQLPLMLGTTPEEAYAACLTPYYQEQEAADLPDEVILHYSVEDAAVLEAWLSERRTSAREKPGKQKNAQVMLSLPQRGLRKELLMLADRNAQQALEQAQWYAINHPRQDMTETLMDLQERLNLPDFPARIECYDISHIQGNHTVASMVVFENGEAKKSDYRRFKIRTAEGKPDDFESMREVMRRRFSSDKQVGKEAEKWGDPDLVIIDGGKGQLSAALSALNEIGVIEQPIISLAKRLEEVFLPGRSSAILLPHDTPVLQLLQRIRDEAHRFAITYHRQLRGKAALHTGLDDIAGLGPKRKQRLLEAFGSVAKIRAASTQELADVLGLSQVAVTRIYEKLHAESP